MNQKPTISIVSPVYRAEKIVERLVAEIQKTMSELEVPYEIVLVDDRSPDDSWEVMKSISVKYNNVKSIRLSRNFGQHPAIMAGLNCASGEWIVVMDCDLQDQPKEIIQLYNKAIEGFDVVQARRTNRQDGYLKKLSSKIFSKVYGFFTDTKYDNEIANFGIYRHKVVKSILDISDYIKFFPLFVNFVGFKATSIQVEHASRDSGSTSYSISKLISLAFNSIISFSNKPLKIFVKFGIIISLLSFLVGSYYLYEALTNKIEVLGFTSIIVSIWFLSGVIITTIGITGIYIGKIFDQTKNRPVYIIDEIV
ncbi:glycosyltransferase family 2 protein [Flavobacterium sp.]|jgi:glycosyltransferase involved in cell wall biosynthesis|uniref:glycosyltransferase family 2 protein n=1 Tax=Flavobacterium sp. TaxID=239 RepID=UPI0022C2CD84|nr:glycosyltransferase family 2 protein [Flavobacterium sp.]MCZ8144474.1 glycosyltransferase family 2 protein [Flavobacterium sp.]MCZ8365852.1 glycosyltransferase family 2 protein [Flavobacterium sp.]